jgi:CRP/FNR family cyclic AMP-dependent transcriptional regulator
VFNSRNRRVRKLGLENIAMFSRCTERQLRKITPLMTGLRVPAGKVLARTGEPGSECFFVVSGVARIVRGGTTVENLGPGSHYGEVSLLDGGPRTETVVADTDMELLFMSQSEFTSDDLLVPSVAREMLAELAARLRRAEETRDVLLKGLEAGPSESKPERRSVSGASRFVNTAR